MGADLTEGSAVSPCPALFLPRGRLKVTVQGLENVKVTGRVKARRGGGSACSGTPEVFTGEENK